MGLIYGTQITMAGVNGYELLVRFSNLELEEKDLKQHFSRFGEVEYCQIIRHKDTKKSRGFGFVRFLKTDMVDRAMAARPHEIAGDEIKTNRRAPPDYAKKLESKHSVNELFIGDYKAEISEDDLKKHFSKFGNVTDVAVPKKESGELRGFAIVTFDDYDAVDVCSFKKLHYIGENRLVVSKYIDKKTMNSLHYKYNKNNEYSNALTDDPNLNEILKGVLTLQLANVLDNQGEDGSSSNKNAKKGKGANNNRRQGKKKEEWM